MPQTITIDPITRIEGHLSVKVETTNGVVTAAYAAGESFRGFEAILKGRHPLDAQQVTQRICGVCPVEHAISSVLAQDQAYGVTPPTQGLLIRNLAQAANFIQSHIVHFYTLSAIDFIDITAVLQYQGRDAALNYLKAWVQSEITSNNYYPAAPFLPRFDGDYLADLDLNLGAIRNYLRALEIRSEASKFCAMFAGKLPHVASLVPGGATPRLNARQIQDALVLIRKIRDFIDTAYVPDVVAVAGGFPQYFTYGRGPANYLSYGVFNENGDGTSKLFPSGVMLNGTLSNLDQSQIREYLGRSWFSSASGLHPYQGDTTPDTSKPDAYSWLKAPRYGTNVMQVGPLARVMVSYLRGTNSAINSLVPWLLTQTGRAVADLNSVMGRHATRALECKIIADRCEEWVNALVPGATAFTTFTIPSSAAGMGLTEAARGALGHWMQLTGGLVSRYQCVVPTTWNASPRDELGQAGAMEQSLVGTPIASETSPIEAVRVVRSFDPCLSCAVH
jgi:Ni,Fe-hydrogenase I large subunit